MVTAPASRPSSTRFSRERLRRSSRSDDIPTSSGSTRTSPWAAPVWGTSSSANTTASAAVKRMRDLMALPLSSSISTGEFQNAVPGSNDSRDGGRAGRAARGNRGTVTEAGSARTSRGAPAGPRPGPRCSGSGRRAPASAGRSTASRKRSSHCGRSRATMAAVARGLFRSMSLPQRASPVAPLAAGATLEDASGETATTTFPGARTPRIARTHAPDSERRRVPAPATIGGGRTESPRRCRPARRAGLRSRRAAVLRG